MIKVSRIVLSILCLMMVGTLNLTNSFAQEAQEPAIKEGSGEIISVDTVASTVVAKIFQDESGGTYKEVTLLVDGDTMITSQDSALSISDLKSDNKVTIVYETTTEGVNTANSIMVK